jgi:hypothetical protein
MNEMIEKALAQVEMGITAQIKVLGTGRGIMPNSDAFNSLIESKRILKSMLTPVAAPRKAAVRKKAVLQTVKL